MKTKNPITKVIFRKFKEGQIIALFPEEISDQNPYHCSSYMQLGQHSAADIVGMIRGTSAASPAEYADLKRELENYGPKDSNYNLKVIIRNHPKYLEVRKKEIKKFYKD